MTFLGDALRVTVAPARRLTMELRNGKRTLDAYRSTFDPHLDIATVVFSHVQCVKTRVNLALVSKLWKDASKPAAAYPRTFDFDAFPDMYEYTRLTRIIDLMDNDEALSLPYERVVGLLGTCLYPANHLCAYPQCVCNHAARRGSVRLLKWTRVNNRTWGEHTCSQAAKNGHLPALQYLHENGCPWDWNTCYWAAYNKHWDCLQYTVDNKCPDWEFSAERHAEHLR